MKIQYCSDLHLEFTENEKWLKKNPIKPVAEILILAGDTIYLEEKYFKLSFFDWASDNYKEVYMVPGNHEYYGGFDIENSYPKLELQIRKNVMMLNNVAIKMGNTNLIFSTLWSDLKRNVEFIYLSMADFHFNKYKKRSFLTDDYNKLFKESFKFIERSVDNNSNNKNVVITHHLPSPLCYNNSIKDSFLVDAYSTDLSSFINKSSIDFWIYGHCHWNREEFNIGKTKLLTNQLGYVHEGEHITFDRNKLLNVK